MWCKSTLLCFLNSGFHRKCHPTVAPGKRSRNSEKKKRETLEHCTVIENIFLNPHLLLSFNHSTMVLPAYFLPFTQKSPEKVVVFFNGNILEGVILHINGDIQHIQGNFSVKPDFGRCLANSQTCSPSLSERKQKYELYSKKMGGKNQLVHLLSKQYLNSFQ